MTSDVGVVNDHLDEDVEMMGDDVEYAAGEPEHDEIHLPPPSYSPIIVGLGAVFLVLGVIMPVLLPIGLVVTGVGVWRMAHFPEIDMHAAWLPELGDRKLGMWVFLASEVMFFSSLIGAFVGFKIDNGFEEATEVLSLPLATLGTTVLIVSSFAVVMALEAIQNNDRRVFRNWMLVTLLLGVGFLSIQAFEWYELFHHDITAETLFGTTFFLTTGFHGLHVLGGVVWLGLVMIEFMRGRYSSEDYLGFELFGLYWHFVDVVWIVLFTVIYLIR